MIRPAVSEECERLMAVQGSNMKTMEPPRIPMKEEISSSTKARIDP